MANLYKNSENKVLLSAGSRIIKQPFNFGKSFRNGKGLNNYIYIANLNILLDYIYLCQWSYRPSNPAYLCLITSNNRKLQMSGRSGDELKSIPNGSFFDGGSPTYANSCFATNNSKGIYTHIVGNGYDSAGQTSNVSSTYTSQYINKIYIGAGNSTILDSTSTTIDSYSDANNRFSHLYLFSRNLSISEHRYIYNNALGNEPQSRLGLEIELHCDKAEILDFSTLQDGSDLRVGVRDYSGFNRHGEIINLPAGTIQYKVDYANTNLFI